MTLVIREQALGANHPDVGQTLTKLARVYQDQGKYSEAEGLLKRALVIREQALGANHPDVAWTLNDLALVYRNQGKYAEAEGLFKSIREKALGEKVVPQQALPTVQITSQRSEADVLAVFRRLQVSSHHCLVRRPSSVSGTARSVSRPDQSRTSPRE